MDCGTKSSMIGVDVATSFNDLVISVGGGGRVAGKAAAAMP